MSELRVRWLVLVGAVGLLVSSLAHGLWDPVGGLALPVVSQVLSLVFATIVLLLARRVRNHVKEPQQRPIEPIFAARVAVLAQTCAVYGSLIIGWGMGALVQAVSLVAYRGVTAGLLLAVAGGAVGWAVALCGVIAEQWCRRPPDDPETPTDSPGWGRAETDLT